MMTALLLATLLGGAPMPEVTSATLAQRHLGVRVTLVGVLEHVTTLHRGTKPETIIAVVLDDDTVVWVGDQAPDRHWASLLGARISVDGVLEGDAPSLKLRATGQPVRQQRPVSALVGGRVRLGGTARDAKGGAVLLVGDEPVYLAGLDAWPAKVSGKAMVVTGTLVSRQHLPEASRDARGAISQGATGKQLVLDAPQWRLAAEPKP